MATGDLFLIWRYKYPRHQKWSVDWGTLLENREEALSYRNYCRDEHSEADFEIVEVIDGP